MRLLILLGTPGGALPSNEPFWVRMARFPGWSSGPSLSEAPPTNRSPGGALVQQGVSPPAHRIKEGDIAAPTPPPHTCQGLHGGLVVSTQQLCLDGLHNSLEPTAGTWKGYGDGLTWGPTGTRKALPPCETQQRTLLSVSTSPPCVGHKTKLRSAKGTKKGLS